MAKKKKPEKAYEELKLTAEELELVKSTTVNEGIKVNIKPKTENQKLYWKYLRDKNKKIVICGGAPGCGKSYLSIGYALKALKEGDYDQVKILIPTVEASSALKIGLLPGTVDEKTQPWRETTHYLIKKILKQSDVKEPEKISKWLIDSDKVNFEIMSYIRGRNFDNTLLLLEESENLSPEEMLLAITRCGENSKIVISGDSRQSDRQYHSNTSGLEHAMTVLEGMNEVGIVRFKDEDVVRNDIITKILKVW
jgi:phosphate starvation-inducible PhoH-like protein